MGYMFIVLWGLILTVHQSGLKNYFLEQKLSKTKCRKLREFNLQTPFNRKACTLGPRSDLQNFLPSGPTMVAPQDILSYWGASLTSDENGFWHLTISFEIDSGKTCPKSVIFLENYAVLFWFGLSLKTLLLASLEIIFSKDETTKRISYSIIIFHFTIFTYDKYSSPKALRVK